MLDPAGARGAIRAQLGRVLEGLAPEAIDALAGETRGVFLAGGDELFREGDPGDAAYLILSGRLRALRPDGAGGERVLQEMGPGEFVGEMPLVRPGARAATVRAIRDTCALARGLRARDGSTSEGGIGSPPCSWTACARMPRARRSSARRCAPSP